jgi:hypothetical protein
LDGAGGCLGWLLPRLSAGILHGRGDVHRCQDATHNDALLNCGAKNAFFSPQVFLCVSRACLGNTVIFINELIKNDALLRLQVIVPLLITIFVGTKTPLSRHF